MPRRRGAKMREILLVAAILFAAYGYFNHQPGPTSGDARLAAPSQVAPRSDQIIAEAFSRRQSNLQVSGQGVVVKVLADDRSGSRHQRFIIKLASGQTLLVAHNIDLAPRVASIREGDSIQFNGEYEWNQTGGVLHWTHRDPKGAHAGGWLKHQGKTFQ